MNSKHTAAIQQRRMQYTHLGFSTEHVHARNRSQGGHDYSDVGHIDDCDDNI